MGPLPVRAGRRNVPPTRTVPRQLSSVSSATAGSPYGPRAAAEPVLRRWARG
jgi:hypothetical protein